MGWGRWELQSLLSECTVREQHTVTALVRPRGCADCVGQPLEIPGKPQCTYLSLCPLLLYNSRTKESDGFSFLRNLSQANISPPLSLISHLSIIILALVHFLLLWKKHHDQGNSEEEGFIWAYGSRGLESIFMVEGTVMAASAAR